ncbi:MAG TPA: STAS domain-containing protein [Phycisphaerae bacterium]|jgi:anti-anti-sigma factor|nr:STAS domain-containing protein [Phycisphaerae bacterium]
MNVRCEDYDHVTVVSLTGELNADNAEQFRTHIEARLQRKVRFFVIDLETTTFIDSKGLEALLWVQEQCDEQLGQVRLCKPDDTCKKILQVTRLDGRFDVFSDVTEAVKTMR